MFEEQFIRKEFVSSADGTRDWYLVRKGRENAPCILKLHGHGSNGDQLIRRNLQVMLYPLNWQHKSLDYFLRQAILYGRGY